MTRERTMLLTRTVLALGALLLGGAAVADDKDAAHAGGYFDPAAKQAQSITLDPSSLPPPITRSETATVKVVLETIEREAEIHDGANFRYWTFNGQVPGPFVRVRAGDTVEVTLKNAETSQMAHSVDFHAVTGPGGGAVATQTLPGEETGFSFKALNPGIYVYHCATPMVADHIQAGMYGLILVEPEGGLPPVDREFYVMQGEVYTDTGYGTPGQSQTDYDKLLDEKPEYYVFNGAATALVDDNALKAETGETIRMFFGVGGPNKTSSFHVIGEILEKVYGGYGALTVEPDENVQTVTVAPGGATVVDLKLEVPGHFLLVDHALSRMERGLVGHLVVEGAENKEIFDIGEADRDTAAR